MAERTQPKPWEPLTTLAGMALLIVLGLGMISTGVFAIPGAAVLAYGILFPLSEAWLHLWNLVERFVDWWREGRE